MSNIIQTYNKDKTQNFRTSIEVKNLRTFKDANNHSVNKNCLNKQNIRHNVNLWLHQVIPGIPNLIID